jgi:hypothetical protein
MRIAETQVFPFVELSDKAKEKAREWWREDGFNYEWWDFVYDDAVRVAEILGIKISTHGADYPEAKGMPKIYFSGFSPDYGNGAHLEGGYAYAAGWKEKLVAYAPKDKELLRIGQGLQDIQKRYGYTLSANIEHVGHYDHSDGACIYVAYDGLKHNRNLREVDERVVKQCLTDFMDWIYAQVMEAYEWLSSDEVVDDTIVANEYEFTAGGKIW